jgi:2-iminobutanoate/2-iminopropanoate deaminase
LVRGKREHATGTHMARRRSINIEGFRHKNPIPNVSRIGNILVSGLILGVNPATGAVATTIEEQCTHMFVHMKAIVETGGGSTDDIIKVTVYLKDRNERTAVNAAWIKMFSDPQTRPERHAKQAHMEGASLVRCDFMAIIDDRQ